MSILSVHEFYTDPETKLTNCTLITEDGEWISFWSESQAEGAARARWIKLAFDVPFIIEDDQE